jgi:hypothetical protein
MVCIITSAARPAHPGWESGWHDNHVVGLRQRCPRVVSEQHTCPRSHTQTNNDAKWKWGASPSGCPFRSGCAINLDSSHAAKGAELTTPSKTGKAVGQPSRHMGGRSRLDGRQQSLLRNEWSLYVIHLRLLHQGAVHLLVVSDIPPLSLARQSLLHSK